MKSIQIRKACMAARVFVMTRQIIKKEKGKKGKKKKETENSYFSVRTDIFL